MKNTYDVERLIGIYKKVLNKRKIKEEDLYNGIFIANAFVLGLKNRLSNGESGQVLRGLEKRLITPKDIPEFHLLGAVGRALKESEEGVMVK